MQAGQSKQQFARRLAVIALTGLALRLAIRLVTGTDSWWSDGYAHYGLLAQSLTSGHGYAFPGGPPTAFRVPLYPMFLALVTGGAGSPWPAIIGQALASSITVVFAGLIAWRLASPAAGLIAATITALFPYSAWHDLTLQESGLFAALTACATWLLIEADARRGVVWPLAAGVALGLAMLSRSTLLPFVPLALFWLALPRSGKWRPLPAVLAAAALVLTLSPWLAWSHRVTGTYGFGTESGAALYAGNHPLTFSSYPVRSIDESRAAIFLSLSPAEKAELAAMGSDEAAQDRWFRAKGLAEIAARPLPIAAGTLRKEWAAFGPWPTPRHGFKADMAYAVTWLPLIGLALAGMVLRRNRWRDDLLLYAHLAAFVLTTALFWAQTAHRSYLDPYLAVWAGAVIATWLPAALRKRLES